MDDIDSGDDPILTIVTDDLHSTIDGSDSEKTDDRDTINDADGRLSDQEDSPTIADKAVPAPPWPPTEFYSPEVLMAQKKSLSSLQHSLLLCHEMDAFAKHTMTKLNEGANTFQLMDDQQTEMEKDLLETADNFEEMAKCCGLCPWKSRQWGPIEDAPDAPVCMPLPSSRTVDQPGHVETIQPASLVIIPHDRVELQMEYEMELVEGFIDHLEEMSTNIHTKLGAETEIIETVIDKMDNNIIRVLMARKKAKALLKTV